MDIRRKDEEQNEQEAPQSKSKPESQSGGGGAMRTILTVVIVAALVGAGYYFSQSEVGSGSDISGPVAIVNGEEISGDVLSEQLQSLRNANTPQAQQFNNLSDIDQQEVLLEGIINTELQLQAARGAGVTVSDEEVETQLQSSIDQIGRDEFENRLVQNDVTEEEVREDLRNQLLINAYIEQEAGGEITATEAEINELYQQYAAQIGQASPEGQEVQTPSLEELRPQIEQAVIQQKRQQIAVDLLNQARENAEIEILLEGVSYPAEINQQQAPATQTQSAPTTEGAADAEGEEESEIETETEAETTPQE
ncbi:MAG: SurA N-terminal domain-containing protein [Candidatus Paceibacterota bacterium]